MRSSIITSKSRETTKRPGQGGTVCGGTAAAVCAARGQGAAGRPYYNPNLTHDREDFRKAMISRLKQGRVEVFPPPASQKREAL